MELKDLRLSIIGAGALGGAVARGLARAGCEVTASVLHPERRRHLEADGVALISDNARAASQGQVVMFAVKPHLTLSVVGEVAPLLEGKLCVSLAAAVPLELLERTAPTARWARAMPNICAAMNDALHNGDNKTKSQRERNKQKVVYRGERKLRPGPIDRSDFRHFIPLSNLR